MKILVGVATAALVVIAAVLVYTTFVRDPDRGEAQDYFSRYLDTCDEAEAARDSMTLNEQLATPPDFDCGASVDELLDRWEDEGRPAPDEIAKHPTPRPIP